jgi:hypothetical protein
MKKTRWLSAAAGTAMLVGAFALPGTGVAYAATSDGPLTSLLSGNSLTAPISAPINLCGISVGAILGGANSNCVGGASSNVTEVNGPTGVGGGGFGGSGGGVGGTSIGSGNNVNAPVSVPVNVCGVAAGVAGGANARCLGGASSNVTQIGSPGGRGGRGGRGGPGGTSILSGNNVNAPVSIPVDVCGVAIALLGEANAECIGGATTNVADFPTRAGGGNAPGGTSILSGNNVNAPISIPVNVCGVSLAVLGQANSSCAGGSFVNPPPPVCHERCTPPVCHERCTPPVCHRDCTPPICHGPRCGPPVCQGGCTPPVCHRDCTPPVCHGTDCGTCHSTVCTTCHGSSCTVCHGTDCVICHGSDCSPPPTCQAHCTPPGPGGNTPPGGNSGTLPGSNSQGSTPGGGTVASMTGSLPTTGANLLAMGVAAVAALGVGAGTVVVARRRRAGDAA